MSPNPNPFVQKIEEIIVILEKIAAISLFSAMILGMLAKILLRNFSQNEGAIELIDSISWMLPHAVMVLGLIGASLGISRAETIHIDLLNRLYSPRLKALVGRTLYILVAALGALFVWLAWQSAGFLESGWIFLGYIPGLCLITLKALFRLVLGLPAAENSPHF